MRYYAAVLTGAMAQIASVAYMWLYTEMGMADVLFWSILAYFAGILVFLKATESKKRKEERKERKFQVYDLREEGWRNV